MQVAEFLNLPAKFSFTDICRTPGAGKNSGEREGAIMTVRARPLRERAIPQQETEI